MGRNRQVDGGNANGAAQFFAVLHGVGQAVGMAEEFRGPFHIAVQQQCADIGGAHFDAVDLHQGDNVAADAQFCTFGVEFLGIPFAAVAKMEILAADQMAGAVFFIQHFGDKILPGHMHHTFVEVGKNDVLNAVQAVDQIGPVCGGVDQLHRCICIQIAGMAVKGKHCGRQMQLFGTLCGFVHQHTVAAVDAIEKAQSDDPLRLLSLFQINSPAFRH